MDSGVNMLCFTASYTVALAAEALGLWVRPVWRRGLALFATLAGLTAHSWYLAKRVQAAPSAPLSSHHDWYLTAAWILSLIYLACLCYRSRAAAGLFLLPLTLGLISASYFAPTVALRGSASSRFWSQVHGYLLSFGTVAVLLGLATGVMYLLQSNRLKRKMPPGPDSLRLPSLEWLEQANSRALGVAAACVALGFLTGVIAQLVKGGQAIPWTDPVVLSLAAMLGWLIIAEGFRLVYPAARHGRKVAYLTLAAFVFLSVALASFASRDNLHRMDDSHAASSTGDAT
ncbi:MAG: hypothetical protein KDA61_06005 [Planctomycetales bacterium]|nr:hypothetical protein [Planctomycetales bacterium]